MPKANRHCLWLIYCLGFPHCVPLALTQMISGNHILLLTINILILNNESPQNIISIYAQTPLNQQYLIRIYLNMTHLKT